VAFRRTKLCGFGILLASIVGGILIFFMGAFNHMALGCKGAPYEPADSAAFIEDLKTRALKPRFICSRYADRG